MALRRDSALMLVCVRLRHVAGTQWVNKKVRGAAIEARVKSNHIPLRENDSDQFHHFGSWGMVIFSTWIFPPVISAIIMVIS